MFRHIRARFGDRLLKLALELLQLIESILRELFVLLDFALHKVEDGWVDSLGLGHSERVTNKILGSGVLQVILSHLL